MRDSSIFDARGWIAGSAPQTLSGGGLAAGRHAACEKFHLGELFTPSLFTTGFRELASILTGRLAAIAARPAGLLHFAHQNW